MRELIRIGEALLVTTGIGGVCIGIPIAIVWLLIKLGTDRNENRVTDLADAYGDVPAMPHAFHSTAFTSEAEHDHGAR